jgi:alanine racemase
MEGDCLFFVITNKMPYSIQKIKEIINGELLNPVIHPFRIERLLFDSRHLVFPARTLFFAFKSKRQNGHLFIKELYEQGVYNYIVTETVVYKDFPKANFILVKNSVDALQQLATQHRAQFSFPIIGITGSNGKTIVKEWLSQLLATSFNIVKSPASYNSQIGVPLSIWQMEAFHNLGIFEGGISQAGEMEKIAPVIDCSIGLFTNIGEAHSEGFINKTQKIKEKLKLFKHSKTIVYCRDHAEIDAIIQKEQQQRLFTWSQTKEADIQIKQVQKKEYSTTISFSYQANEGLFQIPFTDDASIENAINCFATLLLLGISIEKIQKKMPLLEPISMRLELKRGINNSTIINDSYNSDLTSLELILNFAAKRNENQAIILILSDILQSGLSSATLYQQVAQLIIAKNIQRLIAIGPAIAIIEKYLPADFSFTHYENTQAFLRAFNSTAYHKHLILLKGARVFEFEKIRNRFAEKVHKAVLEVDLSAIVHNLKTYGQYLKENTKLIAMVKASAYGSGSVEVAKILAFYKVDYLAVAYADEGVELRKAGVQLPILVLNPEVSSFQSLLYYHLEPEIYSIDLLEQLIDFLGNQEKIGIHLKLDTGMHRLGFEEKDLPLLLGLLEKNNQITVKSIFSHLAASDMQLHDDFTTLQVNRFLKLYEQICQKLGYRPYRHILNSSGILRFPQYQFEMVRLGIGLYGIDGSNILQSQLKVVNTLKATISQIKTLKQKETVGYNRSGKIYGTQRIATINIGYADGLARKTGNGKYAVSVQGEKAPIIGNVCMDMCMIDITHIPKAKVGDEVIIFGDNPNVIELANCLDTIPYEVFTNISNRVKRIYYRD